MMTSDYTTEYIAENIGVCFDYALSFLKVDYDRFIDMFVNSRAVREIENNNPKYMYGMSGVELCLDILNEVNMEYNSCVEYYSYDRNEYYWVGYSISNYARYYGYSYKYIFSYVSLLEMIGLYSKYHEIDDRHLINKLDSLKRKTISNLKRIRESKHLSQSELASLSSMSLRTLQAYEQKQKDINKADVATMVRISKILECDIEDLLEH